MIECRYCTLATIQVFNCFPEVFGASRLEIVQVISLASLDHVHNFIPEVFVYLLKTSWKLEPCFLAGNQSIPPPSVTATDATSTLLPAHIDVQPSLSPSQSPTAMECSQSEELDS